MTDLTAKQLHACLEIIDQSLYASSAQDVEAIWHQLCDLCHVQGLALSVAETSNHQHIEFPSSVNFGFPKGWFNEYINNKYQLVDPVVEMGFNHTGVFSWQAAFSAYGSRPESQTFLQHAAREGLTASYAIATKKHRLSSIASVSSVSVKEGINTSQIALIKRILPHLNEIIARPGFLHAPKLTKRELQVIHLTEDNLSNTVIAEKLGLTPRTVKFHFNNIYKKLAVNNKAAAIRKARILGILV